jgi:transcriptional regulator with XRE-family HTH domain
MFDAADDAVGVPAEIVDEITWYMREREVSRADLAGAMGVSPGRVSQILSGGERLTQRTLASVLAALGVRLEVTLRPM